MPGFHRLDIGLETRSKRSPIRAGSVTQYNMLCLARSGELRYN